MSAERYQGFLFIPAELAEDVDLDVGRKKEILFAHAHLRDWNHWQVLDLPWNASVEAVRDAYVDKVKIFHPDRYSGRRLGSYQARIEAVFRRLTEAKDVLADPARRAPYAQKTAPPEERAKLEARKIQDEVRAKERRARLARTNPLVARAGRIAELIRRGKQSMEQGRHAAAANDFLTAVGFDPANVEAKALAEEARRRADADRARESYERGLAAEAIANAAAALACFVEAAEIEPANPRYAVHAARTALRLGDVAQGRQLAETAVRSGPRHAPAHEVLAEVLAREGQPRDARKELEKALEIDPNLESARAQLKKLRWSILG